MDAKGTFTKVGRWLLYYSPKKGTEYLMKTHPTFKLIYGDLPTLSSHLIQRQAQSPKKGTEYLMKNPTNLQTDIWRFAPTEQSRNPASGPIS